MLKVPLLIAYALALAFGGAVAASLLVLDAGAGFGTLERGAWTAWPAVQTFRADPYARAFRARHGEILLGGAEGLVFSAAEGDDGARLSGSCAYRLTGTAPQARFWSLHVADEKGRPLSAGPEFPAGLHSRNVLRGADGGFSIDVSAEPAPGNWIALRHDGPVRFVLTLIDTPVAGTASFVDLAVPAIRSIGCR